MLKTTQRWKPFYRGLTFSAGAPGILGRFLHYPTAALSARTTPVTG